MNIHNFLTLHIPNRLGKLPIIYPHQHYLPMPILLTTNIPHQYIVEATVHLPVGKVALTIQVRFTVFGELLEYQCPILELPEAALLLTFGRKGLRKIEAEVKFMPYRLTFMAYMPLVSAASPHCWQSVVQQLQKLRGFKMPKQLPYPKCQAFTQLFAHWFKPSKARCEEELMYVIGGNLDMGALRKKIYDDWLRTPIWLYVLNAPFPSGDKKQSAYYLSFVKDKSVLPELITALQDESTEVRERVVETLSIIGDQSVVMPLIGILSDQDDSVRYAAVQALAKIADVRSVGPLILLLNDYNYGVRIAAIKLLVIFGDIRAVEPLIHILLNVDYMEIKEAAAIALGSLGDARAIEPLIKI